MIGKISGKIIKKGLKTAIIDTGHIGYVTYLSDNVLKGVTVSQDLSVWTRLVVREDVLDLYGFVDESELELFDLLTSVPGIGPRSALSIVSLAPVATLRQAIASGRVDYLTGVSGIGKKSAEKIILELRDKVFEPETGGNFAGTDGDTLEALKSLGYRPDEAREALRAVPDEVTDANERLREAIKNIGRK